MSQELLSQAERDALLARVDDRLAHHGKDGVCAPCDYCEDVTALLTENAALAAENTKLKSALSRVAAVI